MDAEDGLEHGRFGFGDRHALGPDLIGGDPSGPMVHTAP
jgi:hypothetical protein